MKSHNVNIIILRKRLDIICWIRNLDVWSYKGTMQMGSSPIPSAHKLLFRENPIINSRHCTKFCHILRSKEKQPHFCWLKVARRRALSAQGPPSLSALQEGMLAPPKS